MFLTHHLYYNTIIMNTITTPLCISLYPRHWSTHFMNFNSFNSHINPVRGYHYLSHFIGKKTGIEKLKKFIQSHWVNGGAEIQTQPCCRISILNHFSVPLSASLLLFWMIVVNSATALSVLVSSLSKPSFPIYHQRELSEKRVWSHCAFMLKFTMVGRLGGLMA